MVGGLGEEKMHKLMPEIIQTAERMDIAPHVKDGYIMMFIYMPGVFPEQFRPYIGQVFKTIQNPLQRIYFRLCNPSYEHLRMKMSLLERLL